MAWLMFTGAGSFGNVVAALPSRSGTAGARLAWTCAGLDLHRLKPQLVHQLITWSTQEWMCISFCASHFYEQ